MTGWHPKHRVSLARHLLILACGHFFPAFFGKSREFFQTNGKRETGLPRRRACAVTPR
ncbi:MAG: hypothetical protein MI923_08345 [Phycisphaerales bacterium]|nr:hypothetical protein [Phycisphaerales bacterium]